MLGRCLFPHCSTVAPTMRCSVVHGTTTCWSPAGGDTYPALWRVEHGDGDKEDLDEREVRDALEAASAVPG